MERLKAQSNYLRGRIAGELADEIDHFSDETANLLKHHGMYQQDDRDRRQHLGDHGRRSQKVYQLMVRVTVPTGRLAWDQLLTLLDLCDELGGRTLRITSRQDIQLHGVPKRNVREMVRRINAAFMTTMATCGDVPRNVMCCPAPYWQDEVHRQMLTLAGRLAQELRPQTAAYKEIWLDVGQVSNSPAPSQPATPPRNEEPFLGPTYLPRKFKVGVGLPGDNCVDVYAQDVGLLAVCEDYNVVGYNVLVGGSMGVTPGRRDTFPALAQRMAYVPPEQAIDVVKAILAVFRDFGNRSDRKRARLKYLVADWGLKKFKAKVEEYLGGPLAGPHADDVWDIDDHLGWHEQGDGRWFYGVHVENGRIMDSNGFRIKSALREICRKYQPWISLTPSQGLLLCDIRWEDRHGVEDLLRRHGVKLSHEISNIRRWSAACVALPTCSMAVAESERVLPGLIDQIEVELARLGLATELMTVRMTGCANGCSRPYMADVGLVGRSPGRYAVYLGGRRLGNRQGFLYRDGVPFEQIVGVLAPVLAYYKLHRADGETFGDFCHRKGGDDLRQNAALA
jgi:sulfite reductase (ferredoxin)